MGFDYSRRSCKGLCQNLGELCMGLCSTDEAYVVSVYERHRNTLIKNGATIPEFEDVLRRRVLQPPQDQVIIQKKA